MFIDAAKYKPTDQIYTFESMQDEMAQASGLINKDARANMKKGNFFFSFLIIIYPLIEL